MGCGRERRIGLAGEREDGDGSGTDMGGLVVGGLDEGGCRCQVENELARMRS